ncbi:MAG: N-acetyltransferase, partial [Bacteroidetes bacterium QH_2_64_74]
WATQDARPLTTTLTIEGQAAGEEDDEGSKKIGF